MMNFIAKGDVVTVAAPADVKSGDFVVVGALFGVAAHDAASTEDVEIALRGVFEFAISGLSQGDIVYKTAGGALTATASGNIRVGVATAASAGGKTKIRLDG